MLVFVQCHPPDNPRQLLVWEGGSGVETSLSDIVTMDCSTHAKRSGPMWCIAPLKLIVRLWLENFKTNTLL